MHCCATCCDPWAWCPVQFIRRAIFEGEASSRFPDPPSRLAALKRLVGQGLRILQLLHAAGVRHNDILLRNMLVRWPDREGFQLAVMDFCQAARVPLPPGRHLEAEGVPGQLVPSGSRRTDSVGDGQGAGGKGVNSGRGGPCASGSGSGSGSDVYGGGADNSTHYKWGGSPGTFDQLSLACSLIDALYLPRGQLFAYGWRTRSVCYSILPGVTMGDPVPGARRGDPVPWTSDLAPHRMEYLLLRMTQLPAEGREERLEALLHMLDGVTTIDEGAIKRQRRR